MKVCPICNASLDDNVRFCSTCGYEFKDEVKGEVVVSEPKPEYDEKKDIQENKYLSILCYVGLLVLIPFFMKKDSKFVRFHANQGIVFSIFSVAYSILTGIFISVATAINVNFGVVVSIIFPALSTFFLVLFIIAVVNCCNGEMKRLPLIGKITILK